MPTGKKQIQVSWLRQGFDLYGKMVRSGTQGTVPLLSDPE